MSVCEEPRRAARSGTTGGTAWPAGLAVLGPAVLLSAHAMVGDLGLYAAAAVVPAGLAFLARPRARTSFDPVTGLALHDVDDDLDPPWAAARQGTDCAAVVIGLDDLPLIRRQHGETGASAVIATVADRLRDQLRQADGLLRLPGDRLCVLVRTPDTDHISALDTIARRIQEAGRLAVPVGAVPVFTAVSAGVAAARDRDPEAPMPSANEVIGQAQRALATAIAEGGARICRHRASGERDAPVDTAPETADTANRAEIEAGLTARQFIPWYQPQVCLTSGTVVGVEALARWQRRGAMVPPSQFLPAIEAGGLMPQLTRAMLTSALSDLRSWDDAGLAVPLVSINIGSGDLGDPGFADLVAWELDRFDLAGARLSFELLEAGIEESIAGTAERTLSALARLGCRIEMDDFGTGHASIAQLRRFGVARLKIDRSYVSHVDCDDDQSRMLSAIQAMAGRLDIPTVAEGVETEGEMTAVRDLGCDSAQGYGIARPMPADALGTWARSRQCPPETSPEPSQVPTLRSVS